MHAQAMNAILINPPFADPTQPYVALPTLKGHLRARAAGGRAAQGACEERRGTGPPRMITWGSKSWLTLAPPDAQAEPRHAMVGVDRLGPAG